MELQKFISSFDNFDEFKSIATVEPYNLEIKETNKLFMISFTDNSDFTLPIVRQANGTIFEKGTNKLVHYSFEKTYDGIKDTIYNTEESNDVINITDIDDNHTIDLYFEGSLIKLFYYDDKWNCATSRCIDASTNYWSSTRSFETLFQEVIQIAHPVCEWDAAEENWVHYNVALEANYQVFLKSLDVNYAYSFIIQHPDINQVYKIYVPTYTTVNKVNITRSAFLKEEKDENLNLSYKFKDILSDETKYKNNNYMLITSNNRRVKLLSNKYLIIKRIKGNYPNILLSYLGATAEGKSIIKQYYPENNQSFENIDKKLNKTSKFILSLYHNNPNNVPEKFNRFINQMSVRENKYNKEVDIKAIKGKLCSLHPKTQAFLIDLVY